MAYRGSSTQRPRFHAITLACGFIVGGTMTQVARRFLPVSPVKEFFTTGVTPSIGPLQLDLVIVKLSVCQIAMDVSLLSLLGVLIAYLIARSLF
jgi:hypothetical protein